MEAGQMRLSIFVHEAKGTFWAYCPEFDLTASGSTAEEARESVMALIDEYLAEVRAQPGDHGPVSEGQVDWDSVLIRGGLDSTRTLN
jgi:predicted RNase H-like HicB family nuclease